MKAETTVAKGVKHRMLIGSDAKDECDWAGIVTSCDACHVDGNGWRKF